jgi:CheY-like chemotaxis protein
MGVLLVQSDAESARIFHTALSNAGHEVATAATGEQAIRVALEKRPDVILTELALPVVDGWQVLNVLRTYSPMKEIPILASTSHVEEDGEAKAFGVGFSRR